MCCGISLGPPAQLNVRPVADEDISLECGNPLQFVVHVQDAAGNPASDNRMGVSCKVGRGKFSSAFKKYKKLNPKRFQLHA